MARALPSGRVFAGGPTPGTGRPFRQLARKDPIAELSGVLGLAEALGRSPVLGMIARGAQAAAEGVGSLFEEEPTAGLAGVTLPPAEPTPAPFPEGAPDAPILGEPATPLAPAPPGPGAAPVGAMPAPGRPEGVGPPAVRAQAVRGRLGLASPPGGRAPTSEIATERPRRPVEIRPDVRERMREGLRQLAAVRPAIAGAVAVGAAMFQRGDAPVAVYDRMRGQGFDEGEAADITALAEGIVATAAGAPAAATVPRAPVDVGVEAPPAGGAGEVEVGAPAFPETAPEAPVGPTRAEMMAEVERRVGAALERGASGAEIAKRLIDAGAPRADAEGIVRRVGTTLAAQPSAPAGAGAGPVSFEDLAREAGSATTPEAQGAVMERAVRQARPESVFDLVFGSHKRRAALDIVKLFPRRVGPEETEAQAAQRFAAAKRAPAKTRDEEASLAARILAKETAAALALERKTDIAEMRPGKMELTKAKTEESRARAARLAALTDIQRKKLAAEVQRIHQQIAEKAGEGPLSVTEMVKTARAVYRSRIDPLVRRLVVIDQQRGKLSQVAVAVEVAKLSTSQRTRAIEGAQTELAKLATDAEKAQALLDTLNEAQYSLLRATTAAEFRAALGATREGGGEEDPRLREALGE